MDTDKINRRQRFKVIFAESMMVATVVILVAILALLVSGYKVDSNLEVERQGMIQISSNPANANILIDGESGWLFDTNSSKVLSSGDHIVALSKEGYDNWSKEVTITEGLLYRLQYPQLFLQDRSSEVVADVSSAAFLSTSPDSNILLTIDAENNWQTITLDKDSPSTQIVEISKELGIETSNIQEIRWSGDNAHVLVDINLNDKTQWVIIDLKNPENSINLSQEFNRDFTDMQIVDNSASTILAVQDNNLHKIDVARKQISAVLVKNVINFDHLDNKIIFSALDTSSDNHTYYSAIIDGDETTILTTTDTAALVAINEFYDEKLFTVLDAQKLTIFDKDTNIRETKELSFVADNLVVKGDGAVIFAASGEQVAVIDMEAGNQLVEWNIETDQYWWINDFMLYTVTDGELKVYDFDGLNARTLSNAAKNPATITDKKWLYYVSDDNLIREKIVE